ncbi:MAG: transcription termination factor Rho [Chthoniobacterales bacterium]
MKDASSTSDSASSSDLQTSPQTEVENNTPSSAASSKTKATRTVKKTTTRRRTTKATAESDSQTDIKPKTIKKKTKAAEVEKTPGDEQTEISEKPAPSRKRATKSTAKAATKTTTPRTRKTSAKKSTEEKVADLEVSVSSPASESTADKEEAPTVKKRFSRSRRNAETDETQEQPTTEAREDNAPNESKSPQEAAGDENESPSRDRQRTRNFRDRRGRRGNRNFRGRRRFDNRNDDSQDDFQNDRNGAESEGQFEEPAEPVFAEGIVEVSGKGFGFLRESRRDYEQSNNDVFVTPEVVRNHGLRDGMYIKGETRRGNRGSQLYKLTEIEGRPPTDFQNLPVFEELTTINPIEQIPLETVPDRFTTRVIDLMAPIGKGQRGLIVAPPRTGKTTLLQHIAEAVAKKNPEIKLLVLLVDERPEEVTELRRELPTAELLASSNDSDIKSHTRISQLAIERARRLVEMGYDVFLLMDSITRIGRAFNNARTSGGRTMSGGVDSRALEIPRRLFASARNTEEAGSLTIIATALIETGSRMDDLIFQEFKGTGNMELVLDRKISDQRVYPAADIFLSGTRREELLISADALNKISIIRRGLAGHKPIEAIERLIFFMKKYPTNAELLENIPNQ